MRHKHFFRNSRKNLSQRTNRTDDVTEWFFADIRTHFKSLASCQPGCHVKQIQGAVELGITYRIARSLV